MFVSSACVGLYMKTCYPDEAFFLLLPDSFSLSPSGNSGTEHSPCRYKKGPVPCFPKGRGIRSCYHLMFPKRSHAPAHGVLIIKDPGISNGASSVTAYSHSPDISVHAFGVQLRDVFRKRSPRASHLPAAFCAEQVISLLVPFIAFPLYTACFNAAIWVIIWRFRSFVKSGSPEIR